MWPRDGLRWMWYGARHRSVWERPYAGYAGGCPFPCWVWTQITVQSSSTEGFTPTARTMGSPSQEAGPTARTTAPTSRQKNGAVVRRLTGHARYASSVAFQQLRQVYSLARLHVNFFQPVRRLSTKSRQGARVVRRHDNGATPYQRMLDRGAMSASQEVVLEKLYLSLNPLQLSRQIDGKRTDWCDWHGDRVTH